MSLHLPPYPKKADSITDLIPSETAARLAEREADETEPVHTWFELTYSSYLVLHRTVLQSMPLDWQRRFVHCLRELDDVVINAGVDTAPGYTVHARTHDGKFAAEPIPPYNRGRTQLDLTPRERAHA